jgi:aspartate racemase
MKKNKAIGILGGMGPEASVYFYKTMIEFSITYFGAKNNNDFPEIILYSVPVPDFISNEKDKEQALKMLKERTRLLQNLAIAQMAIACNTAHVFLEDLQAVSKIPFISMIDEVVTRIKKDKIDTVGLLGSPVTLRSQLYQSRLEAEGITTILPTSSQMRILENIIRNVISSKNNNEDIKQLVKISEDLVNKGAQGVILGCTELPVIFPESYEKARIYNSVEILIRALLQNYYK